MMPPDDAPLTWPAVTYRHAPWVHRDPMASRRSRRRNTGSFRRPEIPRIAEATPRMSSDAAERVSAVTHRLTRFDQEAGAMSSFPFAAVLLRGESASSSQIENLTVRARRLSLATLGVPSGPNAELVARNVRAMQTAIAASERLDVAAILRMHEELTAGVLPDAGQLRREWVWIGGDSPVTAAHVGAPWKEIPELLEDLVAFMARRDLDPLVQAAIAHAQFETIHPFTDGNGRTGRAVVSALLRARGVTENLTVPLSSGLLHDLDDYLAALAAYRMGDIDPIIRAFSEAGESAMSNAYLLRDDLESFRQRALASRPRITPALRAVVDLCCAEPAFTGGMVERHAGVSRATAYRTVEGLERVGLLRLEREKIRGQRVWTVPLVAQALDDFARRAGRRP